MNWRAPLRRVQATVGIQPRRRGLILACPRSGTTALSGWLSQFRDIKSLMQSRILLAATQFMVQCNRFETLKIQNEELEMAARRVVNQFYANRCWLAGKTLIDKENLEPIAFPDQNYEQYIKVVRQLFPDVRLLFMVRDPVATVWSMCNREWGYSLAGSPPLRKFSFDECIDIWTRSAAAISACMTLPQTYVCRFESLVNDPISESERICDFLDVRLSSPFLAKPTKAVGFSDAQTRQIRQATDPLAEQLGVAQECS